MIFGGIQHTSTIDFPGVLAAVLFVRGCNLDCFYCYNRGLMSLVGETLPVDAVKDFLEKHRGKLDGIVLSGGEPTIHDDLPEFLAYIKSLGYKVKLDTNGQLPAVTEQLAKAGLVDYFAVDFKSLPRNSHYATGSEQSSMNSMETVKLLLRAGVPLEARTTLYPGLTEEDILTMTAMLPPLPAYRLEYFRMPEDVQDKDAAVWRQHSLAPEEVKALLPKLLESQPNIII